MKLKNKGVLLTLIITIITLAGTVVSNGCGGGFGEKPVPKLLRK